MNVSLPISASRFSGQVERQVATTHGQRVEVVCLTPAPARRQSTLQRFLKALLRSLSALSV